ncbi:MAG: ATP-binding protein [Muribaculaceae bacterium]|nr:ATP-binding protein [Muribaculaceae bacterium]
MALFRYLTDYLIEYYNNQKGALLLTGARQTGKTYAIRQFGKNFESFIEINFIERPDLIGLFSDVSSASDILLRISAVVDKPLVKGKTLIFFDEIQCCGNIVTAIKFLVDEGSYRYALSGSLLGVELADIRSVPVGYMGVKEVYPLDFEEFVINLGVAERIIKALSECWHECQPVDQLIHARMIELYRLYTIVGGMPAVVDSYLSTNNLQVVQQTQNDIIAMYRKDISQYADDEKLKIKEIFDLIPSELDAKNKRFILKRLNEHAKFDRYQNDFLWLSNAGVAIPVYNVEEPKQPLKLACQRNLFKLFSNDVGLLTAQYSDGIQAKILSGDISINFGAIYENVVAQELCCHGYQPFYFNSKRQGELDFIISDSEGVLPIEVKSGKDYERHNALGNVMSCREYNIAKAYVLCSGNMRKSENIIYAPIYMTMFIRPKSAGISIYQPDLSGLI